MIDTLWQDLRYGARMLGRNPGFALIAIVSIAVGVGANAGMFSVADTLVLRPLSASRPSEIVNVTAVVPRSGFASPVTAAVSYPDFVEVRDHASSFASLMAYQLVVTGFASSAEQPSQRTFGVAVSGNFFDTLGARPALGRSFGVDADRVVGRDTGVVIDDTFWQRQFASNPAAIGRRVRVGGVDMTVIGIMPPGFTGPDQFVLPSFYIPLAMLPRLNSATGDELTRRDLRNLLLKGRLKPNVSIARASEDVQLIAANLAKEYPDTNRNHGLTVRTEFDARVSARPALAVTALGIMVLAFAVLLVACANVAGLLASRAPVRAREIAMRMAIGAGRLRLVRQLLIESLLIAAAGGLVGLLLGQAIIEVFQRLQVPSDVPLKLAFALDGRVLIVAMVVACSSAILSSLLPAWQTTRVDLTATLKSVTTSGRARLWGRHILVAGQVALSLILLTVAAFLFRGFQGEIERGPGFRTDRLLLATFSPDMIRYDAARTDAFYTQLVERTKALPRVRSVALTSSPPMDAISVENTPVAPDGYQFPAGTDRVNVRSARIDDGYFEAIGVRLLRGRAFGPADTADATRVAVVNEAFARHYWPGQDPTGKRFRLLDRDGSWFEIIGVAATTKYRSVSEGPTEFIYYSRRQRPAAVSTLIVETEGDAAAMSASVRQVVTSIDPNMPMFDVRTMQDLYNASAIGLSTLLVRIVGGMGSIALVLALTGLYGLMTYSVSRRTREIGIRMAVGAHPGSILRMVLDQGLWLMTIGGAVGVFGSVAILVVLRSLMPFPAMSRFDITPYAIAVPALLVVTMLAAYIPARRAARIDPLKTLRTD